MNDASGATKWIGQALVGAARVGRPDPLLALDLEEVGIDAGIVLAERLVQRIGPGAMGRLGRGSSKPVRMATMTAASRWANAVASAGPATSRRRGLAAGPSSSASSGRPSRRARDRSVKHRRFEEALEVGSATHDNDLAFAALAYLGASLVHADQPTEGMVRLDESLAAVAGGEVDDLFVIEEIFCQMFSACERAHDVGRAEQWLKVGEAVAAQRNLPAVVAYCHTHFGGVMTAAGRWPEAEAALTDAIRIWALGWRTLKSGALARLADLRIRQGRLEEAEQLLTGLSVNEECARPLAMLLLAQGQVERSREILERTLARIDPISSSAVPLLALLVDVHLAAGAIEEAQQAMASLEKSATHSGCPVFDALYEPWHAVGWLRHLATQPHERGSGSPSMSLGRPSCRWNPPARSLRLPQRSPTSPQMSPGPRPRPRSTVSYGCRRLGTSMPQRHCCAHWDCGSRQAGAPDHRP